MQKISRFEVSTMLPFRKANNTIQDTTLTYWSNSPFYSSPCE